MKPGFRQSMTWLHNWAGLLVGWLLFAIAVGGTLSVFRQELDGWTHPELARGTIDQVQAGTAAVRWLSIHAASAPSWFIDLADARSSGSLAYWSTPKGYAQQMLSPVTGAPDGIRDSLGGEFFYRFHFELQLPYPWGRLTALIAAEMMLTVLVTGIVAHRRIFKDFFTFRTGKGQRSWLDGHVAMGVLALPFHLMIGFTGIITLATLFLPWGASAAYRGDQARLMADFYPAIERPAASRPAPLAPIAPMLRAALRRFDGAGIGTIQIMSPGDAAQVMTLVSGDSPGIANAQRSLSFDATTGRLLGEHVEARPAKRVFDTLYGLHMGHFAGLACRWLYFLSGLLLCLAIATGLLLWSAKRRRPHGFGYGLVDRLNIGVVAGLPCATAGFLLANRLLPASLATRATIEVRCFFLVWLALFLYGCLRRPATAWRDLLGLAAMLCLAVIGADAATTTGLPGGLGAGDGVAIGTDATLFAFAAAFAFAASRVRQPRSEP
jgi:uncharacterized iron-regulated membrane protein